MKKSYYEWVFGIGAFFLVVSFDVGTNHPMASMGIIWTSLWIGDFCDSIIAILQHRDNLIKAIEEKND